MSSRKKESPETEELLSKLRSLVGRPDIFITFSHTKNLSILSVDQYSSSPRGIWMYSLTEELLDNISKRNEDVFAANRDWLHVVRVDTSNCFDFSAEKDLDSYSSILKSLGEIFKEGEKIVRQQSYSGEKGDFILELPNKQSYLLDRPDWVGNDSPSKYIAEILRILFRGNTQGFRKFMLKHGYLGILDPQAEYFDPHGSPSNSVFFTLEILHKLYTFPNLFTKDVPEEQDKFDRGDKLIDPLQKKLIDKIPRESLVRDLIKAYITEIVNDTAWSRGIGTLEVDRDDPYTTRDTGMENSEDEIDPTNDARGRENQRMRRGL